LALYVLARIASTEGDSDARDLYERARSRAEAQGMRPLVAHCHLGVGKLSRKTKRPEQAHEHLTAAIAMYRELGMTFWLDNAEAALKAPR